MQHIETVTVGAGGAASITFSAIPDTFTDLLLVLSARTNNEPDSNGYGVAQISFNSSTTNYTNRRLLSNSVNAPQSFGDTTRNILTSGSTNTANTFGNASLYIPNYRSSVAKSFSIDLVSESNESRSYQVIAAGLWNDTSAITSLSLTALSGLFVQYSSASLYGITAGSDGIVSVS